MAEHRFDTPEPVELDVRIPSGDVDVETIDGTESFVTLEGNEKMVEQTEVGFDGRRLTVELKGRKPFGISIAFGELSFGNGRLRVHARVPHGSGASFSTASADLKLRGRYRALDVKTASGDLLLRGEVTEEANVKTVSGDARLARIGGDLNVQSVSGDVAAEWVGGSARTRSVSGDVRLDAVNGAEVTAQSVSGDIEVGVAPGRSLDVDAGSVSGDLTSEVPLASDPAAAGDDAPPLVVRGKTVSGDFRVFRAS